MKKVNICGWVLTYLLDMQKAAVQTELISETVGTILIPKNGNLILINKPPTIY
jgi:hypothetical protein